MANFLAAWSKFHPNFIFVIFPKIRGSWFAVNVNESKIIGKLCSSQSLAEMFHNQTCKVHSFKTCYFPSVWRCWRYFCLSQMKETYKLMEHKKIFWSLTTCIFTSKEESCIKPQNNFQWTKLANPIFFSFFISGVLKDSLEESMSKKVN